MYETAIYINSKKKYSNLTDGHGADSQILLLTKIAKPVARCLAIDMARNDLRKTVQQYAREATARLFFRGFEMVPASTITSGAIKRIVAGETHATLHPVLEVLCITIILSRAESKIDVTCW